MSNLKPELRPDHNGKMVTRHVRADTNEVSTKSFPAPQKAALTREAKELNTVSGALSRMLTGYLDVQDNVLDDDDPNNSGWDEEIQDDDGQGFDPSTLLKPESIKDALSNYPSRTISYMRTKMDTNPYDSDYQIAVLHALTYQPGDHQFMELMTSLHENATDLFPGTDVMANHDENSYTLLWRYTEGQRKYEHLGHKLPENIFESTDEQRSVMEAIHYMNVDMADENGNVDDDLVRLVLEYPSEVDDIFKIIEDRGTQDPQVIREILESDNRAVREGLL